MEENKSTSFPPTNLGRAVIYYAETMEIRMVFAFLGRKWTIRAAALAFVGVPDQMAMVAQDWDRSKFGQLLPITFGKAAIPEFDE